MKTKVIISVLALSFRSALQTKNVFVVADSLGVSVEAEISYEDYCRFHDDEVQPVFYVYEHSSESVFVDVMTKVAPLPEPSKSKKYAAGY